MARWLAALVVLIVAAGCATTGPQNTWPRLGREDSACFTGSVRVGLGD